jgi:competence protein ComEC
VARPGGWTRRRRGGAWTAVPLLLLFLLPPGCFPGQAPDSPSRGHEEGGPASDTLLIHILDVGQGTAVLLQAPTGQTVLVDAGPGARVVDGLRGLELEALDLFIASHNHADHIGGAPAVLRAFPVAYFMDNGIVHTTATYERLLEALEERDVPLLEPERRSIGMGDGTLEILPPPGDPALGHNDNSVGVVVEWGAFRATLPGDAEPRLWAFWLEGFPELLGPVQVHLASHHGSRNGDIPEALASLRPQLVIVSAGRGNRYGHPHAEALELYHAVGARVLTTAECGTITVGAVLDGTFSVASERCGTAVR